jgi:ubiquinone/menaquinone biosynthesis C-methylase UbiE
MRMMKTMKEEIIQYYNELAKEYDVNRFSNSYGDYIHFQENRILKKYLNESDTKFNLDLACGTGRFLQYADYGLDISHEMVKVATQKFPQKKIAIGDATSVPFENSFFRNTISFHLLMHLDLSQVEKILSEINRITVAGGYFIFDIPSKKRRKITGYKATSWHGGNQIDLQTIKEISTSEWELVSYHGIAFFPIHRIPKRLRRFFIAIDNFLCDSIFKEYSSHLIFVLRKK